MTRFPSQVVVSSTTFCFIALCLGCKTPLAGANDPDAAVQRPTVTVAPPLVVPVPVDDKGKAKEKPDRKRFGLNDVFELEWTSDPQISPDGRRIAYLRRFMDRMTDRRRSSLWIMDANGKNNRPVFNADEDVDVSSPRWSPSGDRLAYVATVGGKPQMQVYFRSGGQRISVARTTAPAGNMRWSPDGKSIAFTMFVPKPAKPFVSMPSKPKGAKWAKPPVVVDRLRFRADGRGYLKSGFRHVFVVPADGGTPRQLTSGDFHHDGHPAWSPDGKTVVVSANRRADWPYHPTDSNLFAVDVATGKMTEMTTRYGPENAPAVSPNGRTIAFIGFEDRKLGFQTRRLHLLDRSTGKITAVLPKLDRSIRSFEWAANGRGLYVLYDDHGNTKLGYATLGGKLTKLADDVGGTSIGRPYASGSFSLARTGAFAVTTTRPDHPADIAVGAGLRRNQRLRRLTRLNDDVFGHKVLGAVEELNVNSSAGGLPIQGWIVKPPGFDPKRKYPLLLEIHGGPFANYGDRFSAECQLYAAAGYVVLYVNPRGSTSYGADFANEIHHNYPNQDYDDLMSAVDGVIAKGYIDTERLYVTGGSGGGVLTAWIVGKTNRFRAAVVAKPVINWVSFVFTADNASYYYKYWFPGFPWQAPENYIKRSPLFLAGNVKTPTMLLTGESDYRTPPSEAEQLYLALKLQKIDSVMVRIPGAGHLIARRPSQLIAKVAHILAWFDRYSPKS